jgi:hypothetical protein
MWRRYRIAIHKVALTDRFADGDPPASIGRLDEACANARLENSVANERQKPTVGPFSEYASSRHLTASH